MFTAVVTSLLDLDSFNQASYVNATLGGPVNAISGQTLAENGFLYITASKPAQQAGAPISGFQAVATSPDGKTVYGLSPQILPSNSYNVLVVANASDLTQRQTFSVPAGANALAVSPTTGNVYVAVPDGVDIFTLNGDGKGDLTAPVHSSLGNVNGFFPTFVGTVTSLAVHGTAGGDTVYVGGSQGLASGNYSTSAPSAGVTFTAAVPYGFSISSLTTSNDGASLYASSTSAVFDIDGSSLASALAFLAPMESLLAVNSRYIYTVGGSPGELEVFTAGSGTPLQTLQDGVNGVRRPDWRDRWGDLA